MCLKREDPGETCDDHFLLVIFIRVHSSVYLSGDAGCVLGVGCRSRSRRPAARVTQQTRVNTSQHMLPPPAEGLLTTKH